MKKRKRMGCGETPPVAGDATATGKMGALGNVPFSKLFFIFIFIFIIFLKKMRLRGFLL